MKKSLSAIGVILAVVFGAASLWEITEQDIYWQIRAGDELLRSLHFPEVDTWSFAAKGKPWMNFQWLSTILFRAAFVFGPTGLVLARGLAVLSLFLVLAGLVRAHASKTPAWFAELTLLPLAYLATAFRLQLRSDTLVFIVFAFVLAWRSVRASDPKSPWVYVGAVVLAANLHPGTSPFVMVASGWALYTSEMPVRRTLAFFGALVPACFIAPYHLHVIPFWKRHFFYFEEQVLTNPDHQRFDPTIHLDVSRSGVAGVVWVALSILVTVALLVSLGQAWGRSQSRARAVVALVIFAGLSWLCRDRIRAIPYQVIFGLPFAAKLFGTVWASMEKRRTVALLRWAVPTAVAIVLFPYHLVTTKMVIAFRESPSMYPIESVGFIRKNAIRPNLYHTFAYGAYVVWYLRDQPDFVDPRETPFRELEQDYLKAYASPEHAQMLYERFGVNATLVPIPKTALIPGMGYRDLIEEYMPREKWALVYWDDISVLVVRRIPEHAHVIAEHEYKYLRPNLPPGNFLVSGTRKREEVRAFGREVERCLAERPADAFCKASERQFRDIERAIREATKG